MPAWTLPRLLSCALVCAAACGAAPAARADEPPRVVAARARTEPALRALFRARGLEYPPRRLFLRAFKHEGALEMWAADAPDAPLVLVKVYAVCAASGRLGPKRRQGDLQVPEGFYRVDRLNPASSFHLSLGIDYPNAADRILGEKPLGGDIMIHGACVTVGCIPLQDGPVEEVYLVVADARGRAGAPPVDVHVFPARMDDEGMAMLARLAEGDAALLAFWRSLAAGYAAFEDTRLPPRVRVDEATGAYRVSPRRPGPDGARRR